MRVTASIYSWVQFEEVVCSQQPDLSWKMMSFTPCLGERLNMLLGKDLSYSNLVHSEEGTYCQNSASFVLYLMISTFVSVRVV